MPAASDTSDRIDRRVFLKRTGTGALVGSALWAAPQVLTAPAAFAAASNDPTWTRRFPTTSPTPRIAHAMATDAAGNIILNGGAGSTGYCGDTWMWDGTTWAQQSTTTSPTPRSGHTMDTHITGNIVLYGGTDGTGYRGDTWLWNGTTWTESFPTTSPPPRGSHAMATGAAGNIILYGGVSTSGDLGDTWIWS